MTKATRRRRAICLVIVAAAATSACSAGSPKATVAPSSKPYTPAAVVKQPTAQQVAARHDPAVQCASRVRMALVMSSPSRLGTPQIQAFARAGTSVAERRVFAVAFGRYATATRAVGTAKALNQPSLSVGNLLSECRGAT